MKLVAINTLNGMTTIQAIKSTTATQLQRQRRSPSFGVGMANSIVVVASSGMLFVADCLSSVWPSAAQELFKMHEPSVGRWPEIPRIHRLLQSSWHSKHQSFIRGIRDSKSQSLMAHHQFKRTTVTGTGTGPVKIPQAPIVLKISFSRSLRHCGCRPRDTLNDVGIPFRLTSVQFVF